MLEGWYGKIIGAIVGAIIGRGLLGAIIGLIIGHQFDLASRRQRGSGRGSLDDPEDDADDLIRGGGGATRVTPAELQRAFFEATFQVMGHVAKSDGLVTDQEIGAAREAMARFSLSEADRLRAIELFTAGKRTDFPLEATLERLYRMAGGQQDLRRLFIQIQLETTLLGNGLSARSRAIFSRMCGALRISPLEFAALEAMLRMHANGTAHGPRGSAGQRQGQQRGQRSASARLADAYEALGIAADASNTEVTRAYRKLMSQNHPDKLVANGLPESMVAAAHERTQRILEAYEIIKTHRGMT
jgi:DnaJ like chaperone protein